jgi:hypothetical protein
MEPSTSASDSRVDVDAALLRCPPLTLRGQSGREQLARRSQASRMRLPDLILKIDEIDELISLPAKLVSHPYGSSRER